MVLKISLEILQQAIFVAYVRIDDRHPALQLVLSRRREFLLPVPSNSGLPVCTSESSQLLWSKTLKSLGSQICGAGLLVHAFSFIRFTKPDVCTPRAGIELESYLGLFNGLIVLTGQVEHMDADHICQLRSGVKFVCSLHFGKALLRLAHCH